MIGIEPGSIAHPPVDWFAIAPELALFGAAIVIVLGRSLIRQAARDPHVLRQPDLTPSMTHGWFNLVSRRRPSRPAWAAFNYDRRGSKPGNPST